MPSGASASAPPRTAPWYVDTSRAGTRRWCSMQRCGNRAKVRKFRAAQAG
ncbi:MULTISPECIES: CGNR zinc finger domain-containing protein [unclassified Leifsonia]|nr:MULTISPECIES: CGNR zinc finger domain-containing protein [unclassified Leifsonia]